MAEAAAAAREREACEKAARLREEVCDAHVRLSRYLIFIPVTGIKMMRIFISVAYLCVSPYHFFIRSYVSIVF